MRERDRATCRDRDGKIVASWDDPLAALSWMESSIPDGARWIGYLSYDLGRLFEAIPCRAADDMSLPLFAFGLFHAGSASPPRTTKRVAEAQPALTSTFSRPAYEAAVARVIDYIRAGDVFQVNLSQRFTAPLACDPYELYQRLQSTAPAKYAAYLDFGDFSLIGNSPELFLHVDRERRVITRPIKGTRPRRRHGASTARVDQGHGRAEHDHRPGAQRPRPGVRDRIGPRHASRA